MVNRLVMTDDIIWPRKDNVTTPICLGSIISKMTGDTDSVTIEHLYEMAPGESNGHVTDDVT